jgi:hypothetical protein
MPSPQAPRIAINRPPPKPNVALVAAREAAPSWRVFKSDGTVAAMLARWGKEAGWRVEWKDAPEIAITGDSELDKPDFISAAEAVISSAKGMGYRLRAKAYQDKVLEIREDKQ